MRYVRCLFITLLIFHFSGCLQKGGGSDSVPLEGGGGSGGGTTPVTYNWPFDFGTTASYTFNATKIDFTGGVCRLTANDQLDDTNAASGFGGGTLSGTAWDGTNSYVRLDQSGTPTNTAELDSSWAPQWANLIGYWKFNEVAGATLADSSSSARDLTAVSLSVGQSGQLSYATTMTSSSSTLTATNVPAVGTALSIALWVNVTAHPGVYQSLACKAASCATFQMYLNATTGYLSFYNVASGLVTPTVPVPTGQWAHVAITISGGTISFYVNGILVTTGAGTINDVATGTLQVGNFSTSNPLNGSIDEMGIWNTALTSTQIRNLYDRQSAKYSGTLTSRVMDALAVGQSWTTFSWISTLPFFKKLTDYASGSVQNETSTAYPSLVGSTGVVGDNDLMSGIQGLWHLDEALGTAGAGSVADDSGQAKHGTPSGVVFGKNGKFGSAPQFDGAASYISTATIPLTNTFTVSAWIYLYTHKDYNQVVMANNANADFYGFVTTAAGKMYPQVGKSGFGSAGGPTATGLPLRKWTHVAFTYDSALGSANIKPYINGVADANTVNFTAGAGAVGQAFVIGRDLVNGRVFDGLIDEVAVWNRTLTPLEMSQLYRRGSNRVKHQVRICTTSNCADDPTGANWKGPDGTNQTYFSELNNTSVPLSESGDVQSAAPSMLFSDFTSPPGVSQYFQYRTILESDDTSTQCNYGAGATWCSPEMVSVTVDPVHYDSSAPTIYGNNGLTLSGLTSFAETVGASCTSGVGYNLSLDKITWYYWNGAAWVASNGTAAQSNSAAVISTNAAALGTQVGTGTVYFKAYLQSSGSSACELSDVQLDGTI